MMSVDLSRRLGRIMSLVRIKLTNKGVADTIAAAEKAETFDKLPVNIQAFILLVEAESGINQEFKNEN